MTNDKTTLRKTLLEQIKNTNAAQRARVDAGVLANITACAAYTGAASLFIYVGMAGEISTRDIITHALAAGKTVAVPLCGAGNTMTARLISSPGCLRPGRFGILEPDASCPVADKKDIALALVPALAVDMDGSRLGRGGGYYDRYLADFPGLTLALISEDRLLDQIPAQLHDVRLHGAVTEERVVWFGRP